MTVFAPTNDAWGQLDDTLKAKYAQGEGCIDSKYLIYTTSNKFAVGNVIYLQRRI